MEASEKNFRETINVALDDYSSVEEPLKVDKIIVKVEDDWILPDKARKEDIEWAVNYAILSIDIQKIDDNIVLFWGEACDEIVSFTVEELENLKNDPDGAPWLNIGEKINAGL